jgi:hypothetical protein
MRVGLLVREILHRLTCSGLLTTHIIPVQYLDDTMTDKQLVSTFTASYVTERLIACLQEPAIGPYHRPIVM